MAEDAKLPTQWVVSLAHYQEPDMAAVLPEIRERARQLLATWRRWVPPVTDRGPGDFEDFFEQAARLEAAVDAFGATNCWLFLNEGDASNLHSGERRSKQELLDAGARDYGILHAWSRYDTPWQLANDAVDAYITSPTFQRHAGRELTVCGFVPDDPVGTDLRDALAAFSARHREALIKVARAKHGFYWVELPENLDRAGADALMWEAMDMAPLNYEGRSAAFLLQARVTMEWEYRFFIVGGEVVTGAGCVEEFTPLNNRAQFDDRVRRVRRERTSVKARPDVLSIMLPFAQRCARELAAEGFKTYTLDVALDGRGEPLIVELNGLPNSGLYASDPRFVTRALSGTNSQAPTR